MVSVSPVATPKRLGEMGVSVSLPFWQRSLGCAQRKPHSGWPIHTLWGGPFECLPEKWVLELVPKTPLGLIPQVEKNQSGQEAEPRVLKSVVFGAQPSIRLAWADLRDFKPTRQRPGPNQVHRRVSGKRESLFHLNRREASQTFETPQTQSHS